MCFIFTIPVHFVHSKIKVSNYCFVFVFLIFIFHITFQSFKETSASQLFPGAIPWRGLNTENSVITGSSLKGHRPPFWISVNLSDTFKTQMKQDKQSSPGEKKTGPNKLWCIWSWLIWVSVKILRNLLWFMQDSSVRSCFKRSLMSPTWSYIML